jgi:hypothetical protein
MGAHEEEQRILDGLEAEAYPRPKKNWRDEAAAATCKRARLKNKKPTGPPEQPRESFEDWVKRVGEEAE